MPPRYGGRHRKDKNHDVIVGKVELIGGLWFWDCSQSSIGVDGFVVGHGRVVPVEIKDPLTWRGELTQNERRIHETLKRFGITVEILTDDPSLDIFRPRKRDFYEPARNTTRVDPAR